MTMGCRGQRQGKERDGKVKGMREDRRRERRTLREDSVKEGKKEAGFFFTALSSTQNVQF